MSMSIDEAAECERCGKLYDTCGYPDDGLCDHCESVTRYDREHLNTVFKNSDESAVSCSGYCHQAKDGETFTCSCPCCN